jgi:hypothetical protein
MLAPHLYVHVVRCNKTMQTKEPKMKRRYVIPDLLATLTADALFGGRIPLRPDEPAPSKSPDGALKRLATWLRHARARVAVPDPATMVAPLGSLNSLKDER